MKKVMWLVLFLSACGEKNDMQDVTSEVLAQVGEVLVTADVFDVALKSRGLVNADDSSAQIVFDDVISEAAMANQSLKNKVSLNAEQLALLNYQKMKYQAQNALEAYVLKNPVSDADIAAEYEAVIKATEGLQFHVQHLLFRDEVEAVKVLDQVKSGDLMFVQAMADYVAARPNMRNVGDLGWVNLQQLPASFRSPLSQMSEEQIYPEVVLSDFGAHVLYLKEKKAAQPPSLEEARAGIQKTLEQRLVSKFKQLAVAKAKVKLSHPQKAK